MNLQILHRGFLVGCIAIGFITIVSCSSFRPSPQPNIVLIIGDDISAGDFGCYGHPTIRTPYIDALARDGIRFTNAYLTISQCSPTRCSVITGRYPHNTGAPELNLPLPEGQTMFPRMLREAGYYTAAAGKWHMGEFARTAFDTIMESRPGGEEHWIDLLQERPAAKPFFMWFAAHDAHRPWDMENLTLLHSASDAMIPPYMADQPGTRKDLARYYDEINRLDHHIGLVVEELKRQHELDNTVIMFMADNGRPFPRCKTWLYDSGIKMPFIIFWPGNLPHAGTACDALISAVDIAPTLLDLAGVGIPESMQGISMTALLQNPRQSVRQFVFAEHNWHDMEAHERMVRWKNYVYIRNARPHLANWVHAHAAELSYLDLFELQRQGVLSPAQADVLQAPRPAEMLFDVAADPHQLVNMAADPAHANILSRLRIALDEWQDRTGDTTPEHLTPDNIDRITLRKWLYPPNKMPRGTIPGSERNAQSINDPGPL